MFETSIVAQTGTNRPWTVIAGFSGQVVGVGVLVLVPLIYTEQLPKFDFNSLHVLPPITRLAPAPPPPDMVRASTSRAVTTARVFTAPSGIPRTIYQGPDDVPPSLVPSEVPFIGVPPDGGQRIGLPMPTPHITATAPPTKPVDQPVKRADAPTAPIRQGGDVQAAKIIRRVIPMYPALARQARVSGKVQLLGIIAKDGTVQKLEVISGHPLLTKAAVDAVLQWLYRPTHLNGEPVEVIAPIEVNFTLTQ